MTRTLDQVSALYSCLPALTVHEQLVRSEEVRCFSSELNQLQEALGDSAADDLWRPTISRLKRLRFDLLAAPISPQALDLDEAWQELSRQRTHAEKAESSLLPAVARTLEALESLGQATANPLFDAVVDLAVHSMEAVTVLLCESRLLQSAQAAVKKAGRAEHIRLTVPHELRAASPMDALTVIGAPRWFPIHVFAAPRAPNFFVIRHEWIAVDWKGLWKPSFEVAQGDEQLTRRESPVIQRDQVSPDAALTEELIPELEVRPLLELDWQEQAQGFTVGRALDEGEVDAIVLKLEGANFVLMEDEEKNDAYIVDLDEDDPIHRVPVREVAEGVFILLRTEGGGNYVVDMANHLLGKRAFPARAKQERWKQELREAVAARGADAVVTELKRRGSPRANTSNLRNWQSPRSIRTQDRADFDAILSLGGLDDQRDDFWQTMDLIDRAHSRAGQEIRRRLLAEVRQADRGELIKHGRLEFELEEGGGSLTAFRVEEVRRERRRTVRSQLDQVLSVTQRSLGP